MTLSVEGDVKTLMISVENLPDPNLDESEQRSRYMLYSSRAPTVARRHVALPPRPEENSEHASALQTPRHKLQLKHITFCRHV